MFESFNWDFDIQKSHINWLGDYVITAWLTDNWILGKTDVKARIFNENTITIDMFWAVFFRQFKYKIVTHARVFSLNPKFEITTRIWLFLTNALHFLNKKFGYENMCSWNKIENLKISLPIKKENFWCVKNDFCGDNHCCRDTLQCVSTDTDTDVENKTNNKNISKIDFEFMESFIEDLENERINELNNYLQINWFKNYNLTSEEEKVLEDFENGKFEWGEFKIWELFEKLKVKSLKYKTSELPSEAINEFILPALTAWIQNQWLNNFVPKENATILKNVISISANWANTGATFYQNKEFTVLQDAYAINWKYSDYKLKDNNYLFLAWAISKTIFGNYEWTNKAGWERIKTDKISLPTNKNKPNYEIMEIFISAVQKLVIKDVVVYAERKIEGTRKVVGL